MIGSSTTIRPKDAATLLAELAPSSQPSFLWASDGRLLWANAAAVMYWRAPSLQALLDVDWSSHRVIGQLRLLLRSLAADGSRLEKLQLMPFGRTHALTARVTRLTSADGGRALLVVAGETVDFAQPPKAPLSAPTFALPLLVDAPPPSPRLSHALAAVPADVPALGDQAVANLMGSTPAPAIEVPAEMEIAANVDARENTPSDVGSVDNVPDDSAEIGRAHV